MNRTKGSIAKWQDAQRAVIERERKIITMPMDYDKVSSGTWRKNIALFDYVRYREIELLAEELDRNNIPGAVAEAGVDMGQTSVFLNTLFPERRLYLYDTFERFPQEALDTEKKMFGHYPISIDRWEDLRPDSDERIQYIRDRLPVKEQVHFRKGVFPETAVSHDSDETFAFVLLDMDLYQPMLEGIRFFYPRMNCGGYLMLHDYNSSKFKGTKEAVEAAKKEFGDFSTFPLPDQGGSLIIPKMLSPLPGT